MDKIKFNRIMDDFYKNRGGIDEIYEYYSSRILLHLAVTFRHCGKEFAKDVAQDFFAYLFDAEKRIPRIESPTAWVYAVCDNLARKNLTKDGEQKFSFSDDNNSAKHLPEKSEIDRRIEADDVEAAFRSLKPEEQKIVFLKIWRGFTFREIAEFLNLSYDNVRQIYCRALKRLRRAAALTGKKPDEPYL